MARDNPITRRTAMKVTGAAAATALVAGCSDESDSDDDDDDSSNEDESFDISPDEQIELNGQTGGWEGIAPSSIEGVQNPTLALQEGEEYEIGWTEGDGSTHNIATVDSDEEVLDNTDRTDDPGDGDFLTFDASEEVAGYICEPHSGSMNGNIELQ